MKSILLRFFSIAIPAASLAQGTVIFNNNIPGTLVTHVYLAGLSQAPTAGNGPNDTPPGTTDYADGALLSGSGFSAQIWAAPGANQPESSLQPASPITTLGTGPNAGFFVPTTATLSGVAGSIPATLVVRVWNNEGGLVNNWQAAVSSGLLNGESPLFNIEATGGPLNPAPVLTGLQSFSIASIPEPSIFSLTCLGAAVLVLLQRRATK
jgi:hypothetical protein